MDIQVGDRVTYRYLEIKDKIYIAILNILSELTDFERMVKENTIEILKIERPKYEVVEEKKELLTEEEKEFLKDICKYYDIAKIQWGTISIYFLTDTDYLVINTEIPKGLHFNNTTKNEKYTLKELGLEEK